MPLCGPEDGPGEGEVCVLVAGAGPEDGPGEVEVCVLVAGAGPEFGPGEGEVYVLVAGVGPEEARNGLEYPLRWQYGMERWREEQVL
jgi:hypothetical protein